MKRFILKWFINSVALLIVVHIFSGVSSEGWVTTIVAALILGLLNTFLKPIINFFAFPLQIVTLGLFTLIINAFLFYLAAQFIHGFYVAGFWSAFWAALLFSVFTFLINSLIKAEKKR
jgi:putative membrane protein